MGTSKGIRKSLGYGMNESAKKTIFVLNGPNLNLLGTRQPDIYGKTTLEDIKAGLEGRAAEMGLAIDFRQSNHEGELVDWCQEAGKKAGAVIINAGGYTHTSVAIRDALAALDIPVIEVHLSNIYAREEFRHTSLISGVAAATICGFGALGYYFALDGLKENLT